MISLLNKVHKGKKARRAACRILELHFAFPWTQATAAIILTAQALFIHTLVPLLDLGGHGGSAMGEWGFRSSRPDSLGEDMSMPDMSSCCLAFLIACTPTYTQSTPFKEKAFACQGAFLAAANQDLFLPFPSSFLPSLISSPFQHNAFTGPTTRRFPRTSSHGLSRVLAYNGAQPWGCCRGQSE